MRMLPKLECLDLEKGNDRWLNEFLPGLLCTVLVVPDNPEHGVLFLIKASLNAINKYNWDAGQGYRALEIGRAHV